MTERGFARRLLEKVELNKSTGNKSNVVGPSEKV